MGIVSKPIEPVPFSSLSKSEVLLYARINGLIRQERRMQFAPGELERKIMAHIRWWQERGQL